MIHVLLVEDDKTIAMGLTYSLEQEGFTLQVCSDVASALDALSQAVKPYDLCILDLSLPDGSGYEVCRAVKSADDTPVIFLTACDDEVNVVMGLDMGADDYITKPFRIRELVSRIRSVLRRAGQGDGFNALRVHSLCIYTKQARVTKLVNGQEQEILLTALEYRLLLTLATHEGQVLSRNQLLEGIWDIAGDFVSDNTLTVYIKRLRGKIEDDPQSPALIHTVRGLGYRLGGAK